MSLISIPKQEKSEAMTVRLPTSVVRQLRDYMAFLKTDNTRECLSAMIQYVTSRDREFQKWKKEGKRDEETR